MGIPLWFQVGSLVVLSLILLADLVVVGRRPHEPSMRECGVWVAIYVALALVFALFVWGFAGQRFATEFVAGWLTEYSLSVDNLFVFILVMSQFQVPRKLQQHVLMVGIILTLVLRGVVIVLGAELIEAFSWIYYLFGGWLVYTAVGQIRPSEQDFGDSALIRFGRKLFPISTEYEGRKLMSVVDGRRMLTPILLVFLVIGVTGVLFAFDSIPAIFGLTTSAFIVFTANILALMGLRQLYFLLGGLLSRLIYLNYGLAAVLGFIGVKLVFDALRTNSLPFINAGHPIGWAPDLPTWVSLLVIAGCLGVTVVVSLKVAPVAAEAEILAPEELA